MPEFEAEIKEALLIHDEDLDKELKEQATQQFYYGSLWARAMKAERAQRLAAESIEAELCTEFRTKMFSENPKERITEKMLKEYLYGHPDYKEEQLKSIQLGMVADMFNVAKIAFESRGRMLIELSKRTAENKFYEGQYRAMREEFDRKQEEDAAKKVNRKRLINKEALKDIKGIHLAGTVTGQ